MPDATALRRLGGVFLFCCSGWARAQQPLEIETYVALVLRSHPAAAQSAGLEAAARAERRAARLLPDPVLAYTRARATPVEPPGTRSSESSYALSQTIPWPGRFSASVRAGGRAADALTAEAQGVRWELAVEARQAFTRLLAGRALLDVARSAEGEAASLLALVTRRAELGEARESDRIKARIEWLRQQGDLAAAEREAAAAEAAVRTLAVAPLPMPLLVREVARSLQPELDRHTLLEQLLEQSPRLVAARAEAERQRALLAVARLSRVPDLDLTVVRQKELDKRSIGLTLGLRVPLWNGARGERARAEAAARTSAASAERVRLALTSELEARLKDLQIAAGRASLLDQEILPAATSGVSLVRLGFEEGETSLLDLLDAQRTLRATEREAAEAHLALGLALGEVQKLVGPDFDPWR